TAVGWPDEDMEAFAERSGDGAAAWACEPTRTCLNKGQRSIVSRCWSASCTSWYCLALPPSKSAKSLPMSSDSFITIPSSEEVAATEWTACCRLSCRQSIQKRLAVCVFALPDLKPLSGA